VRSLRNRDLRRREASYAEGSDLIFDQRTFQALPGISCGDLATALKAGENQIIASESPEVGVVFRRDNETYRLVCISKSNRDYLRRFSQVWAFTALCERLPNQVH